MICSTFRSVLSSNLSKFLAKNCEQTDLQGTFELTCLLAWLKREHEPEPISKEAAGIFPFVLILAICSGFSLTLHHSFHLTLSYCISTPSPFAKPSPSSSSSSSYYNQPTNYPQPHRLGTTAANPLKTRRSTPRSKEEEDELLRKKVIKN